MSQAASMAEMASVQPIAGAMYHWTWALAPTKIRRFATWLQGWLTWAGWISMTVGIGNSTAYWITSLVQLNFPGYQTKGWHATLMIYAMIAVTVAFNLFKFGKLVPWIETAAGVMHIVMFVGFGITLLAMAPKRSASFVFLSRVDSAETSGWTNSFVGWNLGLQTSVWAFVGPHRYCALVLISSVLTRRAGFDAAVHLSEEVRRAPNTVPRVMVYTNFVKGLMAWLFILIILFCAGDIDEALRYPQPMLTILLNATGSARAATAMGALLVIIGIMVMVVNVASMSRLSWSWARDGGLPKPLAYVSTLFYAQRSCILIFNRSIRTSTSQHEPYYSQLPSWSC